MKKYYFSKSFPMQVFINKEKLQSCVHMYDVGLAQHLAQSSFQMLEKKEYLSIKGYEWFVQNHELYSIELKEHYLKLHGRSNGLL